MARHLRLLLCPMQPQCRAPIVQHEDDLARRDDGVDEGGQEGVVVGEAVRHVGRLGRGANADEIRRHTSPARRHVGHDVAPDVRRGPVPVEEEDGRAVGALSAARRSIVNIAHLQPKHRRSVE